jgi:SPP1 family predicted phage head-tail adaptor
MILNGKPINPGELRTQITLYSRALTTEAGGFQVPDLEEIAEVWARWTNVHGSEVWAAQSVQAEGPATILIRYRDGLDTTCVVAKGDQLYEIVSIDDIQNRHEYMELKVKLWRPG